MLDPVPHPETVPSVGYGSPEAMEAACDANVSWSRATPPMRVIIGGLMNDKSKVELASEMHIDRFMVARMIKTLRHLTPTAA
jgi:hypothetical protein